MKTNERRRKIFAQAAGVVALTISVVASPLLVAQNEYPPQDERAQRQQEQQDPPYRPFGPGGNTQQGGPPPQSYQPAPATLTIRPGTLISVRTSEWLSSDRNHTGDFFNAELMQPVVVDGWVIARSGQTVMGRVSVADKAKAGGGNSRLGIELGQLILVDGQQLPIQTQLIQSSGGSNNGQKAATLGATTITGAAIGGAVHGGEGAGIGAVIGAMAGMVGVMLTPGRPTVIPPEAQLTFRVESPVTISTEHSQQAFYPVGPEDFGSRGSRDYDAYQNGPRTRTAPVPPPPPAAYPPPAYYYGGYYPGWGYYPSYGYFYGPAFNLRFYGGRGGWYGRGRFRR